MEAKRPDYELLVARGEKLLQEGADAGDVGRMREAETVLEQAAQAVEADALARYYLGLAGYRQANVLAESDRKAALACLDRAAAHLREATNVDSDFGDAYALLASVYGRKIALRPYLGIALGPLAQRLLERARAADPENPRVLFAEALSDYNRPRLVGGNRRRAVEKLERAAVLFATPGPTAPARPSWGHDDVYTWLGRIHMDAGDRDGARDALTRALAVNPRSGIARRLLGQLHG